MKKIIKNLTLNQKLAAGAGALGVLALLAGDPYVGSTATLNTAELAAAVQKEIDHISARELADWIIQGKVDFRLLDVRSENEYAEYHIPGAEQVTIAGLETYSIQRNEKILLYSDGGVHSAQAWFFLKARKYPAVYILRGGLEEWKEAVLFPEQPDPADEQGLADFEKMKQVSKFFGGSPRTGGEERPAPALSMPKLEMPAPAVTPGSAKKKKEGC